jgi:hypothetical protein
MSRTTMVGAVVRFRNYKWCTSLGMNGPHTKLVISVAQPRIVLEDPE